tara:strand:- start:410 stop:580 length:171 start_codon:yes stop_codon:yes gene_type:complete
LYKDLFKIRLPREVLSDNEKTPKQSPLNLKESQIVEPSVKKKSVQYTYSSSKPETD